MEEHEWYVARPEATDFLYINPTRWATVVLLIVKFPWSVFHFDIIIALFEFCLSGSVCSNRGKSKAGNINLRVWYATHWTRLCLFPSFFCFFDNCPTHGQLKINLGPNHWCESPSRVSHEITIGLGFVQRVDSARCRLTQDDGTMKTSLSISNHHPSIRDRHPSYESSRLTGMALCFTRLVNLKRKANND